MVNKPKKMRNNWMERLVVVVTILIIVLAALFYFSGTDPNDVIGSLYENAADQTPGNTPSSTPDSTPSSTPSPQEPEKTGFDRVLPRDGALSVIILDVGQGNSVFLQMPGGKTMLVDAGEAEYWDALRMDLDAIGVSYIDVLVGTHPHSDHIGSMQNVVENYEIGDIYLPSVEHETNTYINLLQAIRDKGLKVHFTKGGNDQTIKLDPDVEIRILAPLSDSYKNLNNYSIGLRIAYLGNAIILTADAERLSETEMLNTFGDLLQSNVMLIGHHGSNTSTSAAFLSAVNPEAAIISVGEDNSYGHPHEEILERLEKRNIPIYRTDNSGSIGVFINANGFEIVTEKDS